MDGSERVYDFQRLAVYRKALDLVELADRFAPAFAGPRRHLGWQLHRAATSVPLNLAEGTGRYRSADKAQFYVIATGSAMECAAILDIADRLDVGPRALRARLRDLLAEVIPMLVSLSRAVRTRPTSRTTP